MVQTNIFGDLQVVAFDDFKRLSTGTSLAEVKVSADIFRLLR